MSFEASSAVTSAPSPALRLRASRERLRDAMTPPPAPPPAAPTPPNAVQRWLASLRSYPVVGEVAGSLGDWWAKHPLRPMARMASEATAAAAKPVAERHPVVLVSASAVAGALLWWTRPWKWALRSALFAGLVPQLASKLISKLPMGSWLTMLGTVFAGGLKQPTATPTPTASPVPVPYPAPIYPPGALPPAL